MFFTTEDRENTEKTIYFFAVFSLSSVVSFFDLFPVGAGDEFMHLFHDGFFYLF